MSPTPPVRPVPASTYRLQIRPSFDLTDAARLLGYLAELGVDWVYLSPILAAEPGSDHGYDVVDHARVDPARGGIAGLTQVAAEARRLRMGVLVDIVPNHVGVATPAENAWWWDLLTHGRDSSYAEAFDVAWDADSGAGGGRLVIPVVGDGDADAIRLEDSELRYHDHRFPVAPGTLVPGDVAATHDAQHYRLAGWREADHGLNYRRFFAVNTLAGIRVEDRRWFDASHAEIGRWFAGEQPLVDGLRVDHPDGLRDPEGYLRDLADLTGDAYVLVEKILEGDEELPDSWATAGTTGYDAMALVDRVLVDPDGEAPLTALEARLTGAPYDWETTIHDTKRAVADTALGSEVRRIVRELRALPAEGELTGHSDAALVDGVAELLACFGVYRSYLPHGREHLGEALAAARERRGDLADVLRALAPVLGDADTAPALRFQQTSGMVMAKGVEDCAFYRTSRLSSLTEVGGEPALWSVDPADFHAAMARRQHARPQAMTAGTTHDTKRGEDVRARISVLAEVPGVWESALERLLALAPVPDPSFGSLLWQAVVGAWPGGQHPDLRDRLHAYAEKAMREAGEGTRWTAPDAGYEAAVHACVDAAFDDRRVRAVLDELLGVVVTPGQSNSLAAKLVSLTMPGVPDVYQGSELWEQSLVDPDNRRPVDFAVRRSVLDAVAAGVRPPWVGGREDSGAAKLHLVRSALRLRRDAPERFGSYEPLVAVGTAADHVLAFDRGGAVSVATRLPVGLAGRGGWGETTLPLPVGAWADELTGRAWTGGVRLVELLETYPVALLRREDA